MPKDTAFALHLQLKRLYPVVHGDTCYLFAFAIACFPPFVFLDIAHLNF
jgi:UDP-N-acetylglucosamine 2-epimerase